MKIKNYILGEKKQSISILGNLYPNDVYKPEELAMWFAEQNQLNELDQRNQIVHDIETPAWT